MSRSFLLRALAVTAAGVVSAVATLAVSISGTSSGVVAYAPEREGHWRAAVLECSPGVDATMAAYISPDVDNCLRAIFTQALSAGELLSLSMGLRQAIIDDPGLAGACHNAAHATGGIALQSADVTTIAATYPYSTCEGGFIHGVLDDWGKTQPPIEDFAAVGKACSNIENLPNADPESLSNCYHGIGHAAWIAEVDPVKAAELCAVLPGDWAIANCGEGILMDMYTPAGEGIPHRDVRQAPEELPAVCTNWPQPETPGMVEGCANGAAFTLSRFVIDAASKAGEGLPYPFPKDTDWDTLLEPVTSMSEMALQSCKEMPKEFAEQCTKRLALIIPDTPSLVILEKPGRTAACSPFPPPHRKACMDFKRVNH